MKQDLIIVILLLTGYSVFGQSIIEWTPDHKLGLEDFQSPQTEISSEFTAYSLFPGTNMDFNFHMPTPQFMLTKNFNSKVSTTFNKTAATIIAPDTLTAIKLVSFGRYSFDLAELYSRKFRKEMYEKKGAFSDVNFFQPIFSKLQAEMNAEAGRVLKLTDIGRNEKLLETEHEKVLVQLNDLNEFCKDCKPLKKKKSKKK